MFPSDATGAVLPPFDARGGAFPHASVWLTLWKVFADDARTPH